MNKKIIDYKIINGAINDYKDHIKREMEDKVNSEIKNGYEPLGGLCVVRNSGTHVEYSQAMVKYDNK